MEKKNITNEQLVEKIKNGIDTANNMALLWQKNQGFIHKIVNKYAHFAEQEDLEQESYFGLSAAVEHFNPDDEIKFLTYASFWIRHSILKYIKSNKTIKIPDFMHERIREYNKMIQKWKQNYNREPTDGEICQFLNISLGMLENLKKAVQMAKVGSLDIRVGEHGDCPIHELLPSNINVENQIIDKVTQEQLSSVVWPLVDSLKEDQAKIIRLKFLNNKTLKEIAESEKASIDAIRRKEQRGLRELRSPSKIEILRPFVKNYDRIYSIAFQKSGLGTFSRSWTSSTEFAALNNL